MRTTCGSRRNTDRRSADLLAGRSVTRTVQKREGAPHEIRGRGGTGTAFYRLTDERSAFIYHQLGYGMLGPWNSYRTLDVRRDA